MSTSITSESYHIEPFMTALKKKHPHETEFHQAVHEVISCLIPFVNDNPKYRKYRILERIVEPERIIIFPVTWIDDRGEIQINIGYRIQWSSAIGPYKGGLRFHPSVNLSILKFLGFEQTLKNALTTLPLGGAKGGSDFDPKGKSDNEVMRFCQSFMTKLSRYIGPDTDVPAGDNGVGSREIGYLFGMDKNLRNEFTGVFTGKGVNWGGSLIRPEATGYGCVYFAEEMLKTKSETIRGKICAVSGSGNAAQFTVQKLIEDGAIPVTMSDSDGFIHDPKGISKEKLAWIMELKNIRRGRIKEYAENFKGVEYVDKKARPWVVKCDCAFPCATQNEISGQDAKTLLDNGCGLVSEAANMPSEPEAIEQFLDKKILYGPGKAANAGGVATSGLEMSQNSVRLSWSAGEVDKQLRNIIFRIHEKCVKYGAEKDDFVNYVKGANIAGFVKVADAMIDQGVI